MLKSLIKIVWTLLNTDNIFYLLDVVNGFIFLHHNLHYLNMLENEIVYGYLKVCKSLL